jgi:hypothetical protein
MGGQRGGKESYQSAEVVPDFGNVRVQSDGTRVGIQSIPVLVDLVIQDTNGAPECWVAPVTVDSLLVGLVRFRILLL